MGEYTDGLGKQRLALPPRDDRKGYERYAAGTASALNDPSLLEPPARERD
jgi:hypothetical protein